MNRLCTSLALRHRALPALALCTGFVGVGWAPPVQAGATYGAVGFPGVMGGYAHTVNDHVVLRADYAALRSRDKNGEEEGIVYKGRVKFARVGLFADYFPLGNGFRVTGGMTINRMKAELKSDFHGGVVNVGGMDVPVTPSDYFNVEVEMPRATPYVGIGWGHHGQAAGWGFFADVGVSIGKPKVSVHTNLQERGATQADIDRETRELRETAEKIRGIPQISVGVSYRY